MRYIWGGMFLHPPMRIESGTRQQVPDFFIFGKTEDEMNDYLFGLKGLTVPNAIFLSGLVIGGLTIVVALLLDKFHLIGKDNFESMCNFACVAFWGSFIIFGLIKCSGMVVVIG